MESTKFPVIFPVSREFGVGDWFAIDCILSQAVECLCGPCAACKKMTIPFGPTSNREAQVETFADAYLAACFALAVLVVPLMRNVGPRSAPSPEAH